MIGILFVDMAFLLLSYSVNISARLFGLVSAQGNKDVKMDGDKNWVKWGALGSVAGAAATIITLVLNVLPVSLQLSVVSFILPADFKVVQIKYQQIKTPGPFDLDFSGSASLTNAQIPMSLTGKVKSNAVLANIGSNAVWFYKGKERKIKGSSCTLALMDMNTQLEQFQFLLKCDNYGS